MLKKLIYPLFITSLAFAGYLLCAYTFKRHQNDVKHLFRAGSSLRDLRAKLDRIHDEALLNVKIAFKIDDADWAKEMAGFANAKTKNPILGKKPITYKIPKTDHPVIQVAKQCLIEAGIDPQKVVIRPAEKKYSPAAALQNFTGSITIHTLALDTEALSKKPKKVQIAILKHEIQHFIGYDPLEEGYVSHLLEEYGHKEKEYKHNKAMIRYLRQRETRADLMASCDSIEVAKAFQEDFAQDMKKSQSFPDSHWLSHPSDKERYADISNLISSMQRDDTFKSEISTQLA